MLKLDKVEHSYTVIYSDTRQSESGCWAVLTCNCGLTITGWGIYVTRAGEDHIAHGRERITGYAYTAHGGLLDVHPSAPVQDPFSRTSLPVPPDGPTS